MAVHACAAGGGRGAVAAAAGSPAAAGEPAVPGWHIRLIPGPLMMEHGNDPLRMLRELASLGTLVTRVDAGKVPTLAELDPEVCVLVLADGASQRRRARGH